MESNALVLLRLCEVCGELHEADPSEAREAVKRRVCLHELREGRVEAIAEGRTQQRAPTAAALLTCDAQREGYALR